MTEIVYDAFYLESQTFGMTRASCNLLRATAEVFRKERPGDRFRLANFSGGALAGFEVPGVTIERMRVWPRLAIYGAVYFPFLSPIHYLGGRPDAVFWSNLHFFGKDVPGIRQTVFVHDLRCLRYPETSFKNELWMIKAAVRRLRKSRCSIVTPSGWTKKDVVELAGVEPERIHVVPHGVDGSFRVISDGNFLAAAAARFDLSGKAFLFYVGGFRKHKNLPVLLRAFRELRRRGRQDLSLVLAGDYLEHLRIAADEAGYEEADWQGLRHLGYVSDEDLVVLYNLAICLAFPSINEGFGLPLIEAMACGCPVVCSNATALPEVAGGAGVLADPLDVGGWGEALHAVIEDQSLREALRRKGLARVSDMTWDNTARQVLSSLGPV